MVAVAIPVTVMSDICSLWWNRASGSTYAVGRHGAFSVSHDNLRGMESRTRRVWIATVRVLLCMNLDGHIP